MFCVKKLTGLLPILKGKENNEMSNNIRFPFNAPLNPKDTEEQTYGCRQNNPDICSNNSLPGVCAFVCDDCICKKPSRAWKKKYLELKNEGKK